jgi:putative DNA primase/helicase
MTVRTDPEEFVKFHKLLIKDAPQLFEPFYFTLEKEGKDPLSGVSWKNNRKTFEEAYNLMKRGYNIGIAATDKDPLVIVDVDDKAQVPEIKKTLKAKSRKRIGEHNFFFTDDIPKEPHSAKNNIPTEDAGEVRSCWQYVVAAGSFVACTEDEISKIPEDDRENAGKYSVSEEDKVANIIFEELPDVYKNEVFRKEALAEEKAKKQAELQERKAKLGNEKRESSMKSALWDLTIYDVTGKRDDPNFKFPSPFHDSKTYKDTSISGGVMHCWRHLCCHSALTYLAVEAGVSTCNGAGYPHGGGVSDVDFEDPYTVYTVWKYAKDKGFIPENDPIPYQGLVYYALNRKICTKKQLIGGWKLPGFLYHIAVLLSGKEGLNLGR